MEPSFEISDTNIALDDSNASSSSSSVATATKANKELYVTTKNKEAKRECKSTTIRSSDYFQELCIIEPTQGSHCLLQRRKVHKTESSRWNLLGCSWKCVKQYYCPQWGHNKMWINPSKDLHLHRQPWPQPNQTYIAIEITSILEIPKLHSN